MVTSKRKAVYILLVNLKKKLKIIEYWGTKFVMEYQFSYSVLE